MAYWLVIHPLLCLLLVGLALYGHIKYSALSLPIPPPLTVITAILPFFAAINAIYYPRILKSPTSTGPRRLVAIVLQALQAILTTALATLFFSEVVPSAARECLLSVTWQRLFSAHDADSIRRIQDALNCCGFNTVRDRSWPFTSQQTPRECAETYGRNTACVGPWQIALRWNAGLDLGVVLGVGVLQIASLLLVEILSSFRGVPNGAIIRQRVENDPERTRLLPGATGTTVDRDDSGYGAGQNEQRSMTNRYGGISHETESPQLGKRVRGVEQEGCFINESICRTRLERSGSKRSPTPVAASGAMIDMVNDKLLLAIK